MKTQTTLPACLTRTSADDRADARDVARYRTGPAPGKHWPVEGTAFDAALAAIQRREAEVVSDATVALSTTETVDQTPASTLAARLLPNLASDAAEAAFYACQDGYNEGVTLDQRGRLLDAARALVAVTIEVAR